MRAFGRYQLLEPLASGGMAEVWRARVTGPAGVEKEVALKLLRGDHLASSELARMLVEEARLAARLTHANVVQVFELVEEGDRRAIAMELVRGHDLGRVLEQARRAGLRLGLPRALHLCVEVARALDYAHRLAEGGRPLGLVHRDVSPQNVLVSFEGEVKLADFGIARARSQAGLTDPGAVKGKLAYMAPEQAGGGPVDARADVFALAVLAWELCAGRRLFARDSDAATVAALLSAEPISPPSAWNEAVPPDVDQAILAGLAREPSARLASAGELGSALSAALLRLARTPDDLDLRGFMHRLWPDGPAPSVAREPTALRPAAPASPTGAPPAPAPEITLTVGTGRARRRVPGALVALALAAALVVVVLGVALRAPRPGPAAAPTPPAAAAVPDVPGVAARPRDDEPPLRVDPALDPAAAARGEGRVVVSVHPWATVAVDGRPVGETPQDLRLPPGPHRLRVVHPTFGQAEVEVVVEAGRRLAWHPVLSR